MVKLIHTADLHIGASFASFGRKASMHRKAVKEAFSRVIELSLDSDCDVLIIAGDLFDRAFGIAEKDVSFVLGELSKASELRGVVILPGSHDYWARGSVYELNAKRFEALPNVRILRPGLEKVLFEELSLAIHGRVLRSNVTSEDPLIGLKPDSAFRFNVALAHGSVVSAMKPLEQIDIPLSPERLESGFDYLALGHWHSYRELSFGGLKASYSGSPELVARDQEGSGYVVMVELSGSEVKLAAHKVGRIGIKKSSVDCSGIMSTEELVDAVRRSVAPDPTIVLSLSLGGLLPLDSSIDLDEAVLMLEDLYHSVIVNGGMPQVEIPKEIMEQVPESTVAGRFMRILMERIESSDEGDRRIYEEALQIGYQLFRGKNPLSE